MTDAIDIAQAHVDRIAELEAENKRLRGELKRICDNAEVLAEQFETLMVGYGEAMAMDLHRNCQSPLLVKDDPC